MSTRVKFSKEKWKFVDPFFPHLSLSFSLMCMHARAHICITRLCIDRVENELARFTPENFCSENFEFSFRYVNRRGVHADSESVLLLATAHFP